MFVFQDTYVEIDEEDNGEEEQTEDIKADLRLASDIRKAVRTSTAKRRATWRNRRPSP